MIRERAGVAKRERAHVSIGILPKTVFGAIALPNGSPPCNGQ
jgi:hypothetical protein